MEPGSDHAGSAGACPEVYLEKAFESCGYRPEERLPVAKALGETSLMFQVHPTLQDSDMHRVADVVEAVLGQASV